MSSRDVRLDRHANILLTNGARATLELDAASDASDDVTTRNEDSLDLGCATYIAHVVHTLGPEHGIVLLSTPAR